MSTNHAKRRIAISGVWVLIICTPIIAIALWVSINYANDQRDAALHAALVRQYEGSIAGCERGNLIRRQLNQTTQGLVAFLTTARTARLSAVEIATTKADRDLNAKAAASYTTIIHNAKLVPIIECVKVFDKP